MLQTFNEISLPEKEYFYSHLNIEDIADADYAHGKMVCNMQIVCLEIHVLDPAKFLSVSQLAWHAALKKTKVKWCFLPDINMLLMVEKV